MRITHDPVHTPMHDALIIVVFDDYEGFITLNFGVSENREVLTVEVCRN